MRQSHISAYSSYQLGQQEQLDLSTAIQGQYACKGFHDGPIFLQAVKTGRVIEVGPPACFEAPAKDGNWSGKAPGSNCGASWVVHKRALRTAGAGAEARRKFPDYTAAEDDHGQTFAVGTRLKVPGARICTFLQKTVSVLNSGRSRLNGTTSSRLAATSSIHERRSGPSLTPVIRAALNHKKCLAISLASEPPRHES